MRKSMSVKKRGTSRLRRFFRVLLLFLGLLIAAFKVMKTLLKVREDPEEREPIGEDLGGDLQMMKSFDGTPLRVEVLGQGPALVLVHGYFGNLGFWHYQRKELSRKYKVITFDQRGHGGSGTPHTPVITVEDLARDLDKVIESFAPEGAVVVGHSMGGMGILKYAEIFPEKIGNKIRGMVLLDTTALPISRALYGGSLWYKLGEKLILPSTIICIKNSQIIERLKELLTKTAMFPVGVRYLCFGPGASYNQIDYISVLARATYIGGPLMWAAGMFMEDHTSVLSQISVPVLVCSGGIDRVVRPFASYQLNEKIADSKLIIIPGAGHMAPIQKYRECNAFIDEMAREV